MVKSKGKNRILTSNLRTIKGAFPRFLSLMIMSFLGVFVFAGLNATAPDMVKTLDKNLDNHNAYDIRIISTLGLTEEDALAIKDIDGIKDVESVHSLDLIASFGENNCVINIATIPETINKVDLIEGRMPEKENEIVVEEEFLKKEILKVGDTVSLESDDVVTKEVSIVGTVESALYYNNVMISQSRGNTSIGSGTIKYYAYGLDSLFDIDYYSIIYATVEGAKGEITSSNKYIKLVNSVTDEIESIKTLREESHYNSLKEETQKKIDDARANIDSIFGFAKNLLEKQIAKAEEELNKLKMPTWYVYDRTDYATYNDYIEDCESIENLAKVFPVVFFAVAVLVSLISMNRMVEENRLEIGTLKSMGFPDSMILSKYLLFSLLATIFGGALGAVLGLIIIPNLIFYIYSILFTLPSLVITIQPLYTLLGFFLAVICVCGTSVFTVRKVLKEKTAELLRPKSPKNGKRILLEKLTLIWNHMKFSDKITARNIFRYKKRVLVTIFGIAGCTAIMLSGFGIKDAIFDVSSIQFFDIYQFDATAYVSDYGEYYSVTADDFLDYDQISAAIPTQSITADIENISGSLIVIEKDSDLNDIALFKDYKTDELLSLEPGKAIINEKLSAMTNLNVGDTLTLVDVDNNKIEVEIGGIATSYINHFVYIDSETYTSMGFTFSPNLIYLHTNDMTESEKDELASSVLQNDNVLNFSYVDKLIGDVDNSLNSLNSVVLILIVLSALLAFVVLYNLSNINITERRREIASLKVLGFYDKEVDNYINRETILLTAIGIGLGLILGIFLSHIIVNTIEIDKCRFINTLKPLSYVYTGVITLSFSLIVNFITHFNLRKINMIDSLKSVE